MKRKIKELSSDELIKVFHANQKLREEIADDWMETQMFYIREYLEELRPALIDWSIGFDNYNYLQIDNHYEFLLALIELQKKYAVLPDDTTEYMYQLRDKFMEVPDDQSFIDLEKQVDDLLSQLLDVFNFITEYPTTADLEEYFLDFYAESRLDDSFYVDDDYTLYEQRIISYC